MTNKARHALFFQRLVAYRLDIYSPSVDSSINGRRSIIQPLLPKRAGVLHCPTEQGNMGYGRRRRRCDRTQEGSGPSMSKETASKVKQGNEIRVDIEHGSVVILFQVGQVDFFCPEV